MVNLLDNPVWSALSTHHRAVAQMSGNALRYPKEVAPFFGAPTSQSLVAAGLAELVGDDETVFLFGPRPDAPRGWTVEGFGHLAQMVCEAPIPDIPGPTVVPLTEAHRSAALELTALAHPRYFRPRTMDLGRHFGVFENGRLAAMIGERMSMPGFCEISALCTHPDFIGRGFARRLMIWISNDNLARGATPFLHVSPTNERARRLYEQNGYSTRAVFPFWSLRRDLAS